MVALLNSSRDGHRPSQRHLILAGMPRTGSSWVGTVLSFAPGFTYYREPDNHDAIPGAEGYFPFLYLARGADDARYRTHMDRALGGQVVTPHTMRDSPGPFLARLPRRWQRRLGKRLPALYFRRRDVLVKLVFSNLALDWLHERFPDAPQVYLLRHPCGQFASVRRQGWEPRPHRLLESAPLLRDHLGPFADVVRSADTFWERAGAMWGAFNYVVLRQTEARPARTLVPYEWLCDGPAERFGTLFERLGLPFPVEARRFIEAHAREADSGHYSLYRDPRQQAARWREEVAAADVAACRRFAEPFGLPFYPDFGPVSIEPMWAQTPTEPAALRPSRAAEPTA